MGFQGKISEKHLYWVLQVLGWSSIVFIETINYTFFIVGEFNWEYVMQFLIMSFLGLTVSHFYKTYFIPKSQFQKKLSRIWVKGLVDVFGITFIMTALLYLPLIMSSDFEGLNSQFIISYFGQLMNLGRYVMGWVIIYYLFHIMKHMQEVTEQKLLLENLAKTSELELLKNQLNPHFLFNSLNSIKALVLIDQEKARDAIIKLSELLRFSLNYEKAPLIALNDEMKEVEKYLLLEQIRFGKRLDVHIQLEEETLELKVPPAMVLTLAENAIKHGINKLPDGGSIHVLSKKRGKNLIVEVTNSGQLNDTFNLGIGLQNVQKRLESLFGENSKFMLDSNSSNEVRATINLPIN